MRKELCLLVLFLIQIFVANASSVSNVRLVDHTSYAISIIQETMRRVEKSHWCSLKVEDVIINISENILGVPTSADVEFTNGFLVSLRSIDIVRSTVQQVWLPLRANTTTVEVRATMRMLDAIIGFDVAVKMQNGIYRSTGTIRYPEIQFPFVIVKNLFTDDITVGVRSNLVRTSNLMQFTPEDEINKIATVLFDWNCTADSVLSWATDIFAPITLGLAINEIEFPRICYNFLGSRACLVNRDGYILNIIQNVISRLEKNIKWCNLKLNDVNQEINERLFKWHAQGTGNYTNGFLLHFRSIDVSNIQSMFSTRTVNGSVENLVSVNGLLNFRNVYVGYDVVANIEGFDTQYFTGVFSYNFIALRCTIVKNLQTNEISVTTTAVSSNPAVRQMTYMPQNSISELLSRYVRYIFNKVI
nr:uncharacterized protein LOC113397352 [Vanessa tameamea]